MVQRKTSSIFIILFLVAIFQLEAFEPVFNSEEKIIFEGETYTETFDLTNDTGELFLWVTAKVKLNKGENWGAYVLSLKINDQFVTEVNGPINRENVIRNIVFPNNPPITVFNKEQNVWFVRYDSDYIAWNGTVPAQAGDSYNKSAFLGRANELINKSDFQQQNYVYVFKVSDLLKTGLNKIEISCQGLPELHQIYPLEVKEVTIARVTDQILAYTKYFMDAIYPWSVPLPEEVNRGVLITAAQNEYEPAVVGLYALSSLNEINVEVSNITSEHDVFPKDKIQLQLIEYKKWDESSSESKYKMQAGLGEERRGITPELLANYQTLSISAGESRQLWLTINSEGVLPGTYNGEIELKRQGKLLAKIPISIEILPINLPDSPVRFGAWFRSKADSPMGREQLNNLKEHGYSFVTVDCYVASPHLSFERGELTIDFSSFDSLIRGYQAEGLNLVPMMYGTLGPIINQISNLTGGAKVGEKAFDKLFVEAFCYIQKHCKENGWTVYFAPIDEPHPYPELMPLEIQYLALLKRAGANTFSTITPGGAYTLREDLDKACQGANFIVEALQGKTGQSLYWEDVSPEWVVENTKWVYKQIRSFPFDRYYHGYLAYRMAIEVLMGFAYNWGSYDWYVVQIEDGELKNSIAWESAREGIDDLRYVECLLRLWEARYGLSRAKEKIDDLLAPVLTDSWNEPTYDNYYQMRSVFQDKILEELNR